MVLCVDEKTQIQAPPPAPGAPGLPAPDRDVRPGRSGHPSGGGQRLHPQARQGQVLAGPAPRFQVHYTPTYPSRLNQVERWFEIIIQRAIRRSSFSSV
jgi:hypothetical protein